MTLSFPFVRKSGGSQRRHLRCATTVLLAVVLALCTVTTMVASKKMALVHYGATVAGKLSIRSTTDGLPGTSRLTNPQGLCGSHDVTDISNGDFLVGDTSAFRVFNTTSQYLSTWFNNVPADSTNSSSANVDGPLFSSVAGTALGTMNTPVSCSKFTLGKSDVVTFFVSGNQYIRYIYGGSIHSYTYTDTTAEFMAVSTYTTDAGVTTLYAVTKSNTVVSCAVNTVMPILFSCSAISLSAATTAHRTNINKGIVAFSDRFVYTTGYSLIMYSLGGTLLANVSGLFRDVKMAPDRSVYAVTSMALYTVNVGATTLSVSLYVGTEKTICSYASANVDGEAPTFCGMVNVFPYNASLMYVTIPEGEIIRSVALPDVQVPIFFGRTPFPIGFVDESAILPNLLKLMLSAINTNVNADDVSLQSSFPLSLNVSTGKVVDATWDTDYTVLVRQQAFDDVTTVPEIWGARYGATLAALEAYYNQTDEVYYGDNNVLPTCNRTKEFLVEKAVAQYARARLNYSLIYTNKTFQTHAVNVSGIKVLMPSPFGDLAPYGDNTTTHPLLFPSDSDVQAMLLQAVRASYPASSKYNLSFSEQTYHFNLLNAAQTTQARWWIQNHVIERIHECAAAAGNAAGNGSAMVVGYPPGTDANATNVTGIGGGNGPELICIPTVGISNQTVTAGVGSVYNDYNYELFLPEGYNFTGSEFASCMNNTDWSGLATWINGQPQKKKKGCNTGCIVGVAVASAAVACVLIAVIVVLTSKRRRLATVVAPPAGAGAAKPQFSSTVNLDEENSSSNPLIV